MFLNYFSQVRLEHYKNFIEKISRNLFIVSIFWYFYFKIFEILKIYI